MDFSWTPQQDDLYNQILRRAQTLLLAANADQWWTRTQWLLCGEMGLLGLSVPEHYGGSSYDALTTAHAIEAFGRGCEDMGLVFSAAAHLFACAMPIVEFGHTDMKRKYLPGLCAGELIGANAITEKDAGSDVFAMKALAVRDGEEYVLTGCKSYVSNGPVADIFIVYAITNPSHGYLGLSGFVVEKDRPGFTLSEPLRKMGLTTTPACLLYLNECRVPTGNRIGREGQGAQIFQRSMLWERSCLFAAYVGQMERQLEQVIRYARERRQFGKALSKHQAIAHRIADMKLRIESVRLLLYHACWLWTQGKPSSLAIALSKLAISEAAIQGGLDAIHIHGALGCATDYGIERMLRDAIPATLFSGTSEMQRNIIASELEL